MLTHLRNAYGTLQKGVPYALTRDIFAYGTVRYGTVRYSAAIFLKCRRVPHANMRTLRNEYLNEYQYNL